MDAGTIAELTAIIVALVAFGRQVVPKIDGAAVMPFAIAVGALVGSVHAWLVEAAVRQELLTGVGLALAAFGGMTVVDRMRNGGGGGGGNPPAAGGTTGGTGPRSIAPASPRPSVSAFAAPAIMLFALIFFAGCAGSLEASRKEGVASRPHEAGALTVPPTARCISLDNNRTTWGAIAKGALALTGGAGLSAIPFAKDDRNAQIALSIGTGVAAAVAAVSLYVEEGASQDWARECAP